MLNKLFGKKSVKAKNFFTLPAKDKKKMIHKSVKAANKMQAELMEKYDLSLYEVSSR